jgi:hypothetical protein
MKLRTSINILYVYACQEYFSWIHGLRKRLIQRGLLAFDECDNVGGHDLEVDGGADRVHRGGGFAAMEMLA